MAETQQHLGHLRRAAAAEEESTSSSSSSSLVTLLVRHLPEAIPPETIIDSSLIMAPLPFDPLLMERASDRISINCGSSAATLTSLSGREWVGDDVTNPKFSIKGSSSLSSSSVVKGDQTVSVDPVPYNTARFSHSQFTYTFLGLGSPGQKLIRLHFYPSSTESFNDYFTIEAGLFTLLTNFSPSINAHALSLTTLVKEFCLLTTHENQPLNIIFTPSQIHSYAFINGLEIFSLPSTLSYCHGGDIGVRVVGQKSVAHIDHTTALETIHRLNVKWDSVPLSSDDSRGMFGIRATTLKQKINDNYNITWKISVDVGFRYLVRLHFSEMGIKMAGTSLKDFILLINHMIATTGAHIVREHNEQHTSLWYKNYMVMVQGHKREGKHDFSISVCSKDEIFDGHIPLEGFEVFKLSNHDNSLASPNPSLPPTTSSRDSSTTNNIIVWVLGRRNAIATLSVTIICLLNIIVHFLRRNWESQLSDEDLKPSNRAKRLCRHFSLCEIKLATLNFNDAYVIGKGGFGKVYKGLIDNEQHIVAIKRLKSDSNQGTREFWTEIEILSELRHVNLVSLIGYCNNPPEMIIVYEYMSRGTLADHLYKLARKNNNNNNNAFSSLSWKQRLNICIGAGRGLDYLHTGHGIIHRDVKTSNILLDENSVAKVSDFGLAKTESGSELQSLKGTFGYFDPDYYRTRIITTKSDVYSFGVVLLEVLCGRPAVEPLADENERSLSMWARDKISKGEVEQIIDPSLRGEISPDSLKAFVRVAERCLHDEPKKRPAMANVVIRLQFALKQQESAESLVPSEEITSVADFFPSNNGNANSSAPNGSVDDVGTSAQQVEEESVLADETITKGVSNVQNVTSTLKEQTYSKMINAGKRDGRKRVMHKISRLLPWNALSSIAKPLNKKVLFSVSAPMAPYDNYSLENNADSFADGNRASECYELMPTPNLRVFSFEELKAATRNFRSETVLGEGGFGIVYKGWIDDRPSAIAVKRLNSQSMQGFQEWQSEVNFLGRLSHPNLVKLLGYGLEGPELLLIYEFIQKGSLENHLFGRRSAIQPLPWDTRVHILIGAARGLAFLHSFDRTVIYRDFKASNVLLDGSYNAKISDFGLAKLGPISSQSHVSTQAMGTYGYAAPEYLAIGHLYVKSDVYCFGVVLVEMLTGLRALDQNRPSGQHTLVDWIKPHLSDRRRLKQVMDSRLQGIYPSRSALHIAKLALRCLEGEPKNRPPMQDIVETLEMIDSANERLRERRIHHAVHRTAAAG